MGFTTTSDDSQGEPDAPPGAIVVRFGERDTSQVRGVTTDTYVSSETQGTNFGASTSLSLERTEKHALLRFDLSTIATGATIVGGRLHVSATMGAGRTVTIARVLEAWTEGTQVGAAGVANWNQRTSTQGWTSGGANPPGSADTIGATFVVEASTSVDLPLALVQAWVDAPATNFGVVMTTETDSDVRLSSREAVTSADRPELVVTYFP